MVSETVADQWSNSLEALNRDLKLVLARLAPGNPGSLREDGTESRTSVHLTREQPYRSKLV